MIKFQNKLWVAQNSALQTKIITAFHASALGGHSGVQATYHRIHRLFHWKGLKLAVEDFVRQCQICQQAKHMNTHRANLQPEGVPEHRLVKKGGKAIPQALFKWSTLPASMATWEDWYVLQNQFPEILAGGPAKFWWRGRCHD